jgi:DNA-binding NtrC family response regulator
MKAKILVVDDEPNMVLLLKRILGKQGYSVDGVGGLREGEKAIQREVYDIVVSDLSLGDGSGIDLLKMTKKHQPHAPFILITAYGSVETAVEAMKVGAFDYISKPFQNSEVIMLVQRALEHSDLHRQVKQLRQEVDRRFGLGNIIGRSKVMQEIFQLVEKIAPTNSSVLITGESGTGKELVAKALHYNSDRKDRPFVAIDCGVIPENLIESELFGHVKGAFTGADRAKRGLFQDAHTGTLFLDEIGNLPVPLQAKLLRALQEKEIKPVGSNETIKVDARVVAASKEDLRLAVEQGVFRNDLYYRLSVIPIHLPLLSQRTEDIPLLIEHFLKKIAEQNGIGAKTLAPEVISKFIEYQWPGNVRELENMIERLMIISSEDEIGLDSLPAEIGDQASSATPLKHVLDRQAAGTEKEMIIEALERADGNRTKAAKLLGISRASLYNKINQYQI